MVTKFLYLHLSEYLRQHLAVIQIQVSNYFEFKTNWDFSEIRSLYCISFVLEEYVNDFFLSILSNDPSSQKLSSSTSIHIDARTNLIHTDLVNSRSSDGISSLIYSCIVCPLTFLHYLSFLWKSFLHSCLFIESYLQKFESLMFQPFFIVQD